jgi:protein-L-isoaspartate O-methyltransferase
MQAATSSVSMAIVGDHSPPMAAHNTFQVCCCGGSGDEHGRTFFVQLQHAGYFSILEASTSHDMSKVTHKRRQEGINMLRKGPRT